ncbi:hypothetical protein JCM14076_16880 [Methylosoma difficile]
MSIISEEIAQNLPDLPLEMQQETLDFVLFLKAKLASRADNLIEPFETRNQQADAAWADYQLSGKSVGNEAVMAWLDTWGTDQESSCPQI